MCIQVVCVGLWVEWMSMGERRAQGGVEVKKEEDSSKKDGKHSCM